MSESIKQLIECERRAKERLDEALKVRENIREQAYRDADAYIRGYIAQKEAELQALDEENKAYIVRLSAYLEERYSLSVEDMENKPVDELVARIVAHVTLQLGKP